METGYIACISMSGLKRLFKPVTPPAPTMRRKLSPNRDHGGLPSLCSAPLVLGRALVSAGVPAPCPSRVAVAFGLPEGGVQLNPDEVQLKILGSHGSIDVRALHRSLGGLINLLSAKASSEWLITELKAASATISVKSANPEIDFKAVFDEITEGLKELREHAVTPPEWTGPMIESLLDMGGPGDLAGVEGIELTCGNRPAVRIDDGEILENARKALEFRHVSLGSVHGTIDRFLSRDGRNEFGMIDEVTGKSVRVTFRKPLESKVIQAIQRKVIAWGELRRDSSGRKISMKLEDLQIVESPESSTGIRQMIGALGSDWTGSKSSVDWVRGQREQ